MPSNYLQELSQFLTQDVQGGRNGSDAPVGETFLLTDHFMLRRPMVEQQMATERLARKFRASLGTTVRSGRGWMEPHCLFDLLICFFYSRGECDAIMDQKGQDGDFLVSINKFFFFCRFYKDIFLNITNVK